MKLMKTISGVRGEIISQDDEKTVLRLPVTRFGGPDSKDLHGEYFDRQCYFGDDAVTVKFALYEHLMNPLNNPYAPEGVKAQVLGKATLAKTDDMARWFDFEIRRSNQYHDYALKLNELGYLATSTQCFPNGKTVDADGRITDWLEGEVTLTPTPADHLLVPKIVELAKSFGLPEPILVKDAESVPTEEPVADQKPADEPEKPAEQEEEVFDAEAAMNAILEQAEGETAPAEQTEAQPDETVTPATIAELTEQVKSANAQFALIKAWVWGDVSISGTPQEGETLFDVLRAIQQMLNGTNSDMKKLQKAQLTFADFVVKNLGKQVREIARESADEREAHEIANQQLQKNAPQTPRYRSSIPDHAPGG
jgi:hypothetical protein